ncbi:uncharacterized protein ACA1_180010 [Acanthamoeba castellanii str. Neff]|uniref:Uncharacterized protein n=1 Tax=Acanthamoeba castellanii (strain ATCC 30010 / Neff) TaxID=1257118 RepID=L8GC95_ACACF|nr:uncharacterized protein ACA1_180010 [Acanthamoeba castellanii str. Neff]ELR10840.1 hypothetical protein ACA1_180010 [Acanthamoeba castellanii str. Neff]
MGKEFGARVPARDGGGGGKGGDGGHHTEGLVVVGRLLECGTCPPSGELHYGLVMPYRPVRLVAGHLPIKAFSLSSSSSSSSLPSYVSPPVPSSSSPSAATPSKDDASNGRHALTLRHHHHHHLQQQQQQPPGQHRQEELREEEAQEATYLGGPVLWVVHGTPELPRPDYHQFSGGLEEFRVGECHRLRLKVKLNGPSPFDEVVDPYLAHPGQRYLCLKADLASPSSDDDDSSSSSNSDDDDDSEGQLDDDGNEGIEEEWEGSEDEDLGNANNSNEDDDEGDGDDSGMEEEAA